MNGAGLSADVRGKRPTYLLSADRADGMARRVVRGLHERGLREGAAVVFKANNSPLLLSAIFGALRARFMPFVIGATLTLAETTRLLRDVPDAYVIRDEQLAELVSSNSARDLPWRFACRPIHFTSGTSGQPKPVWSGWLSDDLATAWVKDECELWSFDANDVHLVNGPLSHSAPLRFALHTLFNGGTVVVPPRFEAAFAAKELSGSGLTTTFAAPVHLQRILRESMTRDASLRLVAHAGSACPDSVRFGAIDIFGPNALVEFYGSTEGTFTRSSVADLTSHRGTVGRALPGRSVRADAEGQLWCRPPQFSQFSYFGDDEKTRRTWDGDWFTVGDLGRVDSEGYVYLDGRRTDLIISGGQNVYPAEIEAVLGELPGVELLAAFGVADEEWGQRVCVAYVGQAHEDTVRSTARELLAGYKQPKSIVHLESMPLTHSGKIDRVQLPTFVKAH